MIVPLAFFSFSGSKLPGYILPAVPAAILLSAELVSRFVAKRPRWESAVKWSCVFEL
jgi:4-amino-4-deoxy-L-arabinose transferase-like glycosyltransferase